jgi:hypothetical protein
MLTPGLIFPGATVALTIAFVNSDGDAVDPSTVKFHTMSPDCQEKSYVYGTDAEISKQSTGHYTAAITPNLSGRWWYRWVGENPVVAVEGDFLVQASAFVDPRLARKRYSV